MCYFCSSEWSLHSKNHPLSHTGGFASFVAQSGHIGPLSVRSVLYSMSFTLILWKPTIVFILSLLEDWDLLPWKFVRDTLVSSFPTYNIMVWPISLGQIGVLQTEWQFMNVSNIYLCIFSTSLEINIKNFSDRFHWNNYI